MATPIIYTFSGRGSGTLGTQPLQNTPFAITLLADAATAYNPSGLYPNGATAVDCPTATAAIFILGVPTAIIAFKLNVILMNNPENNQFWVSLGLAPDQLLLVKNPALRGHTLKESLGPLAGTAPFPVPQSYPLTVQPPTVPPQSLTFTSITSVAFQATLLLPDPPTNLRVVRP
jgi:hypothetical protein